MTHSICSRISILLCTYSHSTKNMLTYNLQCR